MSLFPIKPPHKPVKDYHAAPAKFQKFGHATEGKTRSAFADILNRCGRPMAGASLMAARLESRIT
jgi:hypothetical protein